MLLALLQICLFSVCMLKAKHVCHKSLSVMSKWEILPFFPFFSPGCSISDNIFVLGLPHTILHSKIPTFFPSFHLPPRSCFSAPWPLFICCTVLPNLRLSLPSSRHSPPTIFTDFSNMSFRRLLPPVSWGRRGGLSELLVGKLVELSGTSYYNEAANNDSSCVSVLPLLLWNGSWSLPPSTVSSRCCKNTQSPLMSVNRASAPRKEPRDQESWLRPEPWVDRALELAFITM